MSLTTHTILSPSPKSCVLLLLLWCKTTMKTTMATKEKKGMKKTRGYRPCDKDKKAFPCRFFLFP